MALPLHRYPVSLGLPGLAIHGGAGTPPSWRGEEVRTAVVAGLGDALAAGWAVLESGGGALDAAVAAVASMEDDGHFNAGRGAVPTSAGTVETDAGVMSDDRSGAACSMTWPANPIRAALALAEHADALLLAGPGADAFAADAGLPQRDPATLTGGGATPESTMGPRPSPGTAVGSSPDPGTAVGSGPDPGLRMGSGPDPGLRMGTVGAVALDGQGRLAAATSTGGRRGQPPGRVGDSPVIGAGTWATSDTVSISATGDGEAFIRAGFAHLIDDALRRGVPWDTAVGDAFVAVEAWGGTGGAIVLSPAGELLSAHDTPAMAWGWRSHAGTDARIELPPT